MLNAPTPHNHTTYRLRWFLFVLCLLLLFSFLLLLLFLFLLFAHFVIGTFLIIFIRVGRGSVTVKSAKQNKNFTPNQQFRRQNKIRLLFCYVIVILFARIEIFIGRFVRIPTVIVRIAFLRFSFNSSQICVRFIFVV